MNLPVQHRPFSTTDVRLAEGQTPFTKGKSDKGFSVEDFEKFCKKQEEMLHALMAANAKQVPDADGKGSAGDKVGETVRMVGQLINLKIQLAQAKLAAGNAEKDKVIKPHEAQQYVGKTLSFNDSTRVFDGHQPVNFRYEVVANNLAKDVHVISQVSILDEKGKTVFVASKARAEVGYNNFIWKGCDNKDQKLEANKKYSIKVEVWGEKNSQRTQDAIMAKTVQTGKITGIHLEDGAPGEPKKVFFVMGDKNYDYANMVDIIQDPEESKYNPMDYIDLIGKPVSIDQSKVKVEDASAVQVPFLIKEATDEGKIAVEFFDEQNKRVAYAEHTGKFTAGQNVFDWKPIATKNPIDIKLYRAGQLNPPALNPGYYRYETYLVTHNENGREIKDKLPTNLDTTITKIDSDNRGVYVLDEAKHKFNVKSIIGISEKEKSVDQFELITKANYYLHKMVTYNGNQVDNEDRRILFKLPQPDSGEISEAKITIMDSQGQEIYEEVIEEVYPLNVVPVPKFNELSIKSQEVVVKYIQQYLKKNSFTDLNDEEKQEIQLQIDGYFRSGLIFQASYDTLTSSEEQLKQKLRNVGEVLYEWNRKNSEGKTVPPTAKYTYKIDYRVKEIDGEIKTHNLDLRQQDEVKNAKVEDNKIFLQLKHSQNPIAADRVTAVAFA